jgi:subtilisin family serine protease
MLNPFRFLRPALPLLAALCVLNAAAAPEWAGKLGPHLKKLALGTSVSDLRGGRELRAGSQELMRALPSYLRADRDGPQPVIHVHAMLTGQCEQQLRALGAEIKGRVGDIASLRLPAAALADVASLHAVRWLKAAPRWRPALDESTSSNGIGVDIPQSSLGFDGSGVIVGVVDTGIDWRHDDFRKPDSTSRIISAWDQTTDDPAFSPPPGFTFGDHLNKSDFDNALATSGSLPLNDVYGHGSHVMGIAAGNGRRTGNGVPEGTFTGVAPAADLVVVKVFEGAWAGFCDQCDLIAAVQFIQQVAEAEGKPWVGNMSLGHTLGPHDGSDAVELMLDAAVGPGRAGAQMTLSAGNTGSDTRQFHWEALPAQGITETNNFDLPANDANSDGDNDFIWMDLWYDGGDSFTISIVTPDATTVSASTGTDSGIVCTTAGAIQIDATNAPDPVNGDNQAFIQIWDSSSCDLVVEPIAGSWTIEVQPDVVGGSGKPFDLWNEATARGRSYVVLTGYSLDKTINTPATGRNYLTVGSWVSEDQWINANDPATTTGPCCATTAVGSRSFFSSVGPTRDGRIKPDISAPGEWIGSTISADAAPPSLDWTERDGEHVNYRGTSMAAPHAAGVAALLFGINPDLDGAAVKAAIERAALSDSFTGILPNNQFGHGKLRGHEAVFEASAIVTDLHGGMASGFSGTDNSLMLSYNVYRGMLSALSESYYGDCWLTGLGSPGFADGEPLPAGAGFFYLVTGIYLDPVGGTILEGMLGTDSAGLVRANSYPCP